MDVDLTIDEWLRHPFILLIAGAFITGIFIPLFTRRWQDHQKELDIKIQLIDKINDTVSHVITAIQISEMNLFQKKKGQNDAELEKFSRQELYKAYQMLKVSDEIIKAQLLTYFPHKKINHKWIALSKILEKFFDITYTVDDARKDREQIISVIKGYFVNIQNRNDWDGLFESDREYAEDKQQYAKSLRLLQKSILIEKDNLIKRIVKEHISIFSKYTRFLFVSRYGAIAGFISTWSTSTIIAASEVASGLPISTFYSIVGFRLGINDLTAAAYLTFGLHLIIGTLLGMVVAVIMLEWKRLNVLNLFNAMYFGIAAGAAIYLVLVLPSVSSILVLQVQYSGVALLVGMLWGALLGLIVSSMLKIEDIKYNKEWSNLKDTEETV